MSPQQPEELPKEAPVDENFKFIKMIYSILLDNEVDEKYVNQIMDEVEKVMKGGASVDLILSPSAAILIFPGAGGKGAGILAAEGCSISSIAAVTSKTEVLKERRNPLGFTSFTFIITVWGPNSSFAFAVASSSVLP